ncbi:DUF2530 domain-containing protein [Ornithinimicrobium murale]|uniref:DUF2530 domain-containing protein n=1 Tax=Ornithinimicrobium murale TaxID=1050153 RepID=UPI000E0DE5FF|nr:DUF2530 domain-containing protein [Ornithinimicrobium murale]
MPDQRNSEAVGPGDGLPPGQAPVVAPEARMPTIRIVHWGMVLWAIALLVVLLVPALHQGDRAWWVWVPVAGFSLGAIGHIYLARGRGNAADA